MKLILVLILLISLISCIRTQRDIMIETEVQRLKNAQSNLKTEQSQKEKFLRKSVIQKNQDIEDLKTELQVLSGKIDGQEFKSKQYVDKKLSEYQGQIDLLKEELLKQREEIIALSKARVNSPNVKSSNLSMKALYNGAYSNYSKKNYQKAVSGFKELLKKHPKTRYMENAYYFSALSYQKLKKYEDAILDFEEIIKRAPKSKRLAVVNFLQGICFLKINSMDDAKYSFKKVINKFPKSPQAKKAKLELLKIEKIGKK